MRRYRETFAGRWARMKPWLSENWLVALLFAVLLIFEVGLAFGLIPGNGGIIYWWMIYPGLYLNTVAAVAVAAVVASFLFKHVAWYGRVVIVILFLSLLPIAFVHSLGLTPWLETVSDVGSVSFYGRVYRLNRQDGILNGASIESDPYSRPIHQFVVYECDAVGFWCREIDTFGAGDFASPYDVAMFADSEKDMLYIIHTDTMVENNAMIREYALNDEIHAVNPPAEGSP